MEVLVCQLPLRKVGLLRENKGPDVLHTCFRYDMQNGRPL